MSLIQNVYRAGIIGEGGAGFPTHVKINTKAEYFIINAAECEPLLNTDKFLMINYAKKLVKGVEMIGEHLEAKHMYIALKAKYKDEIAELNRVIGELRSKVELFLMPNFYPAGDEQMIVHLVTKRTVPEAGIPIDVSTVVSNVGTVIHVYDAVNNDLNVTHKYISMLGELREPRMLYAPVGSSVAECIEKVGGSTLEDYDIIMGGPLMGKVITKEQSHTTYIKKTDGGIIVLPKNHYVVARKTKPIETIIKETRTACIQCRLCSDLCHRHMMGHKLRPHRVMRNIGMSEHDEEIMKEALLCCECGICEMFACPMGLSPRRVNQYVKSELGKQKIRHPKGEINPPENEMIDFRRVPTERLIARLHLMEYYHQHLYDTVELEPKKVHVSTRQHIGKPATPIVNVGDYVTQGQLIGKVELEDMGANVHASICGRVVEVNENIVIMGE